MTVDLKRKCLNRTVGLVLPNSTSEFSEHLIFIFVIQTFETYNNEGAAIRNDADKTHSFILDTYRD